MGHHELMIGKLVCLLIGIYCSGEGVMTKDHAGFVLWALGVAFLAMAVFL